MTWNYATIIEKVKDMAETRGLQLVSRKPTHPGEVLREEFMPDFGLSVAQLAQRLGVSRQSMNELVHERRAVRPSTWPCAWAACSACRPNTG